MSRSDHHVLYSDATIGAGGNTSASFDSRLYNEATFYIRIANSPTGTSPTLDFDVETSPDDSNWFKDSDIPQITASGNAPIHKVTGNLGRFIRLVPTVGGTSTPQFTGVNVDVVLKET